MRIGIKTLDRNSNHIADYLEKSLKRTAIKDHGDMGLFIFPKEGTIHDIKYVLMAMKQVLEWRWYSIIKAYYVKIPQHFFGALVRKIENKFYWIEENLKATIDGFIPSYMMGMYKLWNLNISGSKHITVGIIDSGIDTSHIDLQNKLIYYRDVTGESESPIDNIGHGTMVSSIIAGPGTSAQRGIMKLIHYGITDSYGGVSLTVEISEKTQANISLAWDSGENISVFVEQVLENGSEFVIINTAKKECNASAVLFPGLNKLRVHTSRGKATYVLRAEYKADEISVKLAKGIAPNVNLAVWKVFRGLNISTDVSTILLALDDVTKVNQKYNITVINLSISVDKRSVALDEAVNELALRGILVVTSAGNRYIDMYKAGRINNQIGSPGTAQYAITVAAMNDYYGIALYSSRGGVYFENSWKYVKPDITMFGGGMLYGKWAIGADSDCSDYTFPDTEKNDYLANYGTSFSAAYISGALALISGFLFDQKMWEWSLEQVLEIKSLILAASFETALIGKHETKYDPEKICRDAPTFSNGSKDYDEGFGVPYIPTCIDLLGKMEAPELLKWSDIINLNNPISARRIRSEDLIRVSMDANSTNVFLYVYSLYTNDGSPKLQRIIPTNSSAIFLGSGDMVIVAKLSKNCTIRVNISVELLATQTTLIVAVSGIAITVMIILAYMIIKTVDFIGRILKRRKK